MDKHYYKKNLTIIESNIGKDPDKRDYIVSNQKIEDKGFKPKFSLDFGIEELEKAFKIIKNKGYANF